MPTILIEELESNCQVTVIISDLIVVDSEPNPPAEKPEDVEADIINLVGKQLEN